MNPPTSFRRCPACLNECQSPFHFCPQCGTRLVTTAPIPQSSQAPGRFSTLSNKQIGVIALAMFGISLLLSSIAANNQQPVRPSTAEDGRPAALVEPSPSPSLEFRLPKPTQKTKTIQTKPATQAKEEESATSSSGRITTYSQPTTKPSGYITGSRGGCYYINRNGNKTYVDRSLCGSSYSSGSSSFSSQRGYITGSRGGCYYINGNGNKTYVDRGLCR